MRGAWGIRHNIERTFLGTEHFIRAFGLSCGVAPYRWLGAILRDPRLAHRNLGLTDAKDLGAASQAGTLGGRALVLHGDSLWILYISLLLTLHTICLHIDLPVCKILCRDYHTADCLSIGLLEVSSLYF